MNELYSTKSFKFVQELLIVKKALNATLPVSSFWIASVPSIVLISKLSIGLCVKLEKFTVIVPLYLLSALAVISNEPEIA